MLCVINEFWCVVLGVLVEKFGDVFEVGVIVVFVLIQGKELGGCFYFVDIFGEVVQGVQ